MPLAGFPSLCEEHQKEIISQEHGRKHHAYNMDREWVTHYRIDGVVLTEGLRCDFLLINEKKEKAYLIELKGKNLLRAIKQLAVTEEKLRYDLRGYKLFFRAVTSRTSTHDMREPLYRDFMLKWKKRFEHRNDLFTENI